MAYVTEELKEKALNKITKHQLVFLEDVYVQLGISVSTFYDHFPVDSKDSKDIKSLLQLNKSSIKSNQRSKWYKSDAPALQIALYKLISTEDERKRLTSSYTEVSGGVDSIIKLELPKELKDVIKAGFREALRKQSPTKGDSGESS